MRINTDVTVDSPEGIGLIDSGYRLTFGSGVTLLLSEEEMDRHIYLCESARREKDERRQAQDEAIPQHATSDPPDSVWCNGRWTGLCHDETCQDCGEKVEIR